MASSHICNTSLPISGLYFILPRCRFMSHDKIWGQSGTDAQNNFSWFEVSAAMLQTALVGAGENRQQWVVITAQHLPSTSSALVSLCPVEKNRHLLCAAMAFEVTEFLLRDL